ncbi:HNH endonuclease [Clostridium botulinum]|uniref:HNH endonuclease n=1 Tax=Clostridium botulinum TaxID=1491 RepID=UPI0006534ED0|nr:HNH endonuclease [Clostridium botulinum]QPW59789.1 HNH endonuclease [Clostridium botulinum]QPW62268.1 HNH endonuclease [Clostridium phage CWou-2020b]
MNDENRAENYFYNQYRFLNNGKTAIGTLSNGDEFKFDTEDFQKVIAYRWYSTGQGKSNKSCINYKGTYLHRYIMGAEKGVEVDHIDRDRMNNCRRNLRICTHQQNQCNQALQSNNTSGFTGVRFYKPRSKYVARIKFYGKDIHLGYYKTIIEAIQARDVGAKLLFGKFAVLNDVPEASQQIKNYVYKKCSIYLSKVKIAI